MTTQWDDDRLVARVEDWTPKTGQQIGLGQSAGLVVRVYDRGPLGDGRTEQGQLIFDSEAIHGSAGIFGPQDEAESFATRIRVALLVKERWREQIQHERREGLDAAQGVRFRELDRAKAEASEANARAKAQQKEIRVLRDEAAAPDVALDCPLRGDGYRVILAPSLTDGTQDEAEGRTLVSTIQDPKPKTASRRRSGTPAPPKKANGKTKAAKAEPETSAKLPEHVPDAGGKPIRKGSKVEHPGQQITAIVTAIVRQEPDGAFIVEIEDDSGIPLECASTELVKIVGRDPGDVEWPE